VRSPVGVDSCGTREPSLRSNDGGRNGAVTQLVDQKTAVTDGDGTRASSGGAAAHWKLWQTRRWRSSEMAGSVRLQMVEALDDFWVAGRGGEARVGRREWRLRCVAAQQGRGGSMTEQSEERRGKEMGVGSLRGRGLRKGGLASGARGSRRPALWRKRRGARVRCDRGASGARWCTTGEASLRQGRWRLTAGPDAA
jgi:hypothetical protein